MTSTQGTARNVNGHRARPWPVLVSVLVVIALAATWNREVSGQTPAPQALGPYAADFLLRAGGELDGPGTGAGARALATGGPPITTESTCFAAWCGTETVTDPLLLATYNYYRQNVLLVKPPVGSQESKTWFDEGGYYFRVTFYLQWTGGSINTGCGWEVGSPQAPLNLYTVAWKSSASMYCPDGTFLSSPDIPSSVVRVKGSVVDYFWGQFRGAGGVNPSLPPTQQQANDWAQAEIDGGNWATKVKPAQDGAIRPATTGADLQALGITGSPPFDQPPQVRRIAIDAGHGPPGCPGAEGPTYHRLERDLVLEIAQQITADFTTRGHAIIPTRPAECVLVNGIEPDDSLVGRVQRAINDQAVIFVSIHLNGTAGAARGTEIWYDPRHPSGASPDSLRLARLLVPEHSAIGLSLRPAGQSGEAGIKLSATSTDQPPGDSPPGPFRVLTVATRPANPGSQDPVGGNMPAVIDEAAFLNSPGDNTDEVFLENPVNRRRIANAIENAIRRFFP